MVNVQRETPVAAILRDITKYISLIRILARPGELFAIEIGHSGFVLSRIGFLLALSVRAQTFVCSD